MDYRAISLNNCRLIEVDGRKKGCQQPNEIFAFTAWLLDTVRLTILAIRRWLYHMIPLQALPYKHRVDIITRAALWKVYPEEKTEFFAALTTQDVEEFLGTASEDPSTLDAVLNEMTANDFFLYCSLGYQANGYAVDNMTPKEQYYRFANGRDGGLDNVEANSSTAFVQWYEKPTLGGHPWEVCRGGNSTHVSLYVREDKQGGYYLVVSGSSYQRSAETIKFFLALHRANVPVLICDAELLKKRLTGEERVGIVPEGVLPVYCSSWFPNERMLSFINLSYEKGDEETALAEWIPLRQTRLKEVE